MTELLTNSGITVMCSKEIVNNSCSYIIDNFKHFNGKWLDIKMVNSKGIIFIKKFLKWWNLMIIDHPKGCFYNKLILLHFWLWNIQVREQYLNLDSKKVFINVLFWWKFK